VEFFAALEYQHATDSPIAASAAPDP